jgi:predicted nucleotidyltransferase
MDTIVAFTQEYSKVSISLGNEKSREPELIHLGGMVTKD